MKRAIEKCWRDSAALIIASKRNQNISSGNTNVDNCNYDILLQTRTQNASFSNSVVFPGGVSEAADADERWLQLLCTFGYNQCDFDSLHNLGCPISPLFQTNPIQRHVALRITAIRETFEELGLLLCSRKHKIKRNSLWASLITDIEVKYWQNRVSENPEDLFTLCKKYNCYPDIWSIHYWSNWLTPVKQPKRFDTAFFITAIEAKPCNIDNNIEVANVEWANPSDILQRSKEEKILLFPPQAYELNRLTCLRGIDELIKFAKNRSSQGNELFYPVLVKTKDGILHLLPGDYLYPANLDYYSETVIQEDKTVLELRDREQTLHRVETTKNKREFIIQNYKPKNHINMNNTVISFPMINV